MLRKETNRQTDSNILPTPTDSVDVSNNNSVIFEKMTVPLHKGVHNRMFECNATRSVAILRQSYLFTIAFCD